MTLIKARTNGKTSSILNRTVVIIKKKKTRSLKVNKFEYNSNKIIASYFLKLDNLILKFKWEKKHAKIGRKTLRKKNYVMISSYQKLKYSIEP